MARKNNNLTLLIILVIFIGIFLGGKFIRESKRESTLNKNLIRLDTTRVTDLMLIRSGEKDHPIHFFKKGNHWRVSQNGVEAPEEKGSATNLLNEVLKIKPRQLMARDKKKWSEYNLTDSLGTRFQVLQDKKKLVDLYIGKFTYKQATGANQGYGRNVIGKSYFRLAGENEVYAVDGFLPMAFNQGFNSWRDQNLLRLNKEKITKITFKYPADSSFVLEKVDSVWKIGSVKADSTKLANYLSALSYQRKSDFKDGFKPPLEPTCQLTIKGNDMPVVVVQAFYNPDVNGDWILHSSLNPETYFLDKANEFAKKVLVGKEKLLPGSK